MLDLRAEFRQSPGDVKPRNVRGRCQKTTTSRRADCSEHRQAAGASAQDLMRAALWAPNSETQPDGGGLFVRTGVAAVGLGLISGERGTANIEAAFVISLQNEL
jgi:hypothetical protein